MGVGMCLYAQLVQTNNTEELLQLVSDYHSYRESEWPSFLGKRDV